MAFTLEWGERRIRIKPSVEWMREKIETTGEVRRAVPLVGVPGDPSDFREIVLSGSDSKVYHGIGPGLEVETEPVRPGPFMMTVYLSAQAYSFLGDLDITFSDVNEFGEFADWKFEKNRWAYRGGVGLRFRWQPE